MAQSIHPSCLPQNVSMVTDGALPANNRRMRSSFVVRYFGIVFTERQDNHDCAVPFVYI